MRIAAEKPPVLRDERVRGRHAGAAIGNRECAGDLGGKTDRGTVAGGGAFTASRQ